MNVQVMNYSANDDVFTVKIGDSDFFVILDNDSTLHDISHARSDNEMTLDEARKHERDIVSACIDFYHAGEVCVYD